MDKINIDFLPMGSVVKVQGYSQKIMIIDRTDFVGSQEKYYDYTGVGYPEGLFNDYKILAFQHRGIQKVYFKGYVNDMEKEYKSELNENLNKMIAKGELRVNSKGDLENTAKKDTFFNRIKDWYDSHF